MVSVTTRDVCRRRRSAKARNRGKPGGFYGDMTGATVMVALGQPGFGNGRVCRGLGWDEVACRPELSCDDLSCRFGR